MMMMTESLLVVQENKIEIGIDIVEVHWLLLNRRQQS